MTDRRGSDEKPDTARQDAAKQREAERRLRIAIEAYYNAERRGFREGGELDDWLEAERAVEKAAPHPSDAEGLGEKPGEGADSASGVEAPGSPADQPGSVDAAAGAERIEPDQVKKWARQLNVSAPQLREAIRRVGPAVRDVKQFLESSPPPS
jgi:hypothetical protein